MKPFFPYLVFTSLSGHSYFLLLTVELSLVMADPTPHQSPLTMPTTPECHPGSFLARSPAYDKATGGSQSSHINAGAVPPEGATLQQHQLWRPVLLASRPQELISFCPIFLWPFSLEYPCDDPLGPAFSCKDEEHCMQCEVGDPPEEMSLS